MIQLFCLEAIGHPLLLRSHAPPPKFARTVIDRVNERNVTKCD